MKNGSYELVLLEKQLDSDFSILVLLSHSNYVTADKTVIIK